MERRPAGFRWDLPQGTRLRLWQKLSPPQLFVASFAALILVGASGLWLLPGICVSTPFTWVDALFMSTSAVCVTGLAVVDPGSHLTFAGEAFLLLLVQFGGLGVLTFTSLIISALGRRLSLREESLCIFTSEAAPHLSPGQITWNIVRYTLAFELAGVLLLWGCWGPSLGWKEALWPAVFHSVSAFCNAGFSTFSDNLISFQQSPGVILTISGLIVLGGLGFLTHEEVFGFLRRKRQQRMRRFSLQSRIVLVTTAVLIVGGWIPLTILEWDNTLSRLSVPDRIVNGLMLSITPRTAGFNSIDYGQAADATNLLTMILMMIGGSPGSTAGGLKTTTVALLLILAWSRLRGQEFTTVWCRTIPEETTYRAVGLFTIATAVAMGGMLLMTISESGMVSEGRVMPECLFEAISAFNTVGLSMGITPKLTVVGKLNLIVLMFFGRVGLLTLAAALTVPRRGARDFRYASEDVVVG
jgi:trk system potassium uptake protein TrkH